VIFLIPKTFEKFKNQFYRFKFRNNIKEIEKMPLTNSVIIKLNEITTMIEDKSNLKENEIEEIKSILKKIIDEGERYDVDDIESWFENEGTWSNKASRIRITNISHYVQDKFEQTARLKIISNDEDSCSCGN